MEVALQIRATMCIVKEDVFGKKSLIDVIEEIADVVEYRRLKRGLWSGIVLVSDGLVEGHPDIAKLKEEIKALEKTF